MIYSGYKFIFVKIIVTFGSIIAYCLYGSWKTYTPVSERVSNIEYYSFSGIFAINFVPIFFVFIIFGLILSPMMDTIISNKFNLKGVKGLITVILAYLILGVVSGIIISAFFFRLDYMINYISVSMIGAMVFLFFQIVFQFLIFKLGSKTVIQSTKG